MAEPVRKARQAPNPETLDREPHESGPQVPELAPESVGPPVQLQGQLGPPVSPELPPMSLLRLMPPGPRVPRPERSGPEQEQEPVRVRRRPVDQAAVPAPIATLL